MKELTFVMPLQAEGEEVETTTSRRNLERKCSLDRERKRNYIKSRKSSEIEIDLSRRESGEREREKDRMREREKKGEEKLTGAMSLA